jgi:anaerobic selenocysteine-containing dehydrogenase
VKQILDRLIQRDGPRTSELKRAPLGIEIDTEARIVQSVCGFCATGCSLDIHLDPQRTTPAVRITPTVRYPVNLGAGCPKGWEALTPLRSPDRLMTPQLRDGHGLLHPITWDDTAREFCDRMRAVQERHGASSAAFLSTGQIATEEMALLGAFAKFEMGMVHGDGNTRQCMATSVVAYKEAFGFDAPPFTYADFEHSDVIVLVGSNLCIAHPILWERVARNPHSPEIVVIDPRRTETAVAATMHVRPRPGSDLALLLGVASELVRMEAVDEQFVRAHTNGFDDWSLLLKDWTASSASTACDVSPAEITALAKVIASGKRVSLWWTMGVNQGHQAVRTAQAIINIALMTGNIGRPGTGANSITGQCNAMGSRMFSNTSSMFCGRSFTSESDRIEVADVMGIDVSKIPSQPSLAYDQILDAIEAGEIKALWMIGTNTVHSWLEQDRTKATLAQLEFFVVQDLYGDTMTASYAHLLLPAAGWGEKEGSFINAERRFGRIQTVSAAPGDARSDFDIVRTLALEWGVGDWIDQWKTPAAAFVMLKRLSKGRACDITGIESVESLGAEGIQWPYPKDADDAKVNGDLESERRLFADGQFFHVDGRAQFVVEAPVAPPEVPDEAFPLVLLTGRQSSAQWHTGTRTNRSTVLRALSPSDDLLYINQSDALARSIAGGDSVAVTSRRGTELFTAQITPLVSPGQVFIAMHNQRVNRLTRRTVDPHSRQPAAKQSCVQITQVSEA